MLRGGILSLFTLSDNPSGEKHGNNRSWTRTEQRDEHERTTDDDELVNEGFDTPLYTTAREYGVDPHVQLLRVTHCGRGEAQGGRGTVSDTCSPREAT